MTREEKIAELINIRDNFNYTLAPREVFDDAIKALEQEPITSKDKFIYALTACGCLLKDGKTWYEHNELIKCFEDLGLLEQEPQTFKWCTDCKEYDQEKHCCHRWSKVIRNTVEEMKQEYIEREVLDKIRAEIEGILPTYHNLDWSITDLVSISEVNKVIQQKINSLKEDKKP